MNVGDLTPIAMVILVAVIAISIGATVLVSLRTVQNNVVDSYPANSSPAYNITNKGVIALGTFADFFQVIAVVAIAAIVIGLVYMFGNNTSNGQL